jgi:peptidoglycan hydrolase-like protein with peptidoglycan-binding domain
MKRCRKCHFNRGLDELADDAAAEGGSLCSRNTHDAPGVSGGWPPAPQLAWWGTLPLSIEGSMNASPQSSNATGIFMTMGPLVYGRPYGNKPRPGTRISRPVHAGPRCWPRHPKRGHTMPSPMAWEGGCYVDTSDHPLNGRIGPKTLGAVEAFQRAKGLARGGITMETLQALAVNTGV